MLEIFLFVSDFRADEAKKEKEKNCAMRICQWLIGSGKGMFNKSVCIIMIGFPFIVHLIIFVIFRQICNILV